MEVYSCRPNNSSFDDDDDDDDNNDDDDDDENVYVRSTQGPFKKYYIEIVSYPKYIDTELVYLITGGKNLSTDPILKWEIVKKKKKNGYLVDIISLLFVIYLNVKASDKHCQLCMKEKLAIASPMIRINYLTKSRRDLIFLVIY